MDRKQPKSNPVQAALRPTHLSMRREMNCNRANSNQYRFWPKVERFEEHVLFYGFGIKVHPQLCAAVLIPVGAESDPL
jgi:hypothetical protein